MNVCADCGAPVSDRFCGHCGQALVQPPKSVAAMFKDFFASYFNFEGKLWRTLVALVAKPGALTVAHFEGQRTRYFTPIRLYLTVSFLFFTLAAITPASPIVYEASPSSAASEPSEAPSDPVEAEIIALVEEMNRLQMKPASERERVYKTIRSSMEGSAPKVLFFLLPLFALFFKLFFPRRYYAELFVFVLHLHTVVLLALTPRLLLPWPGVRGFITALALALGVVYTALGTRRAFQQSWARIVPKTLALVVIYAITLLTLALVAFFRGLRAT